MLACPGVVFQILFGFVSGRQLNRRWVHGQAMKRAIMGFPIEIAGGTFSEFVATCSSPDTLRCLVEPGGHDVVLFVYVRTYGPVPLPDPILPNIMATDGEDRKPQSFL